MTRGQRVNPPVQSWVKKILREQWDALEAYVPDVDLLPAVLLGARGKRLLDEAYGCGYYGCVLPTYKPNVVFKLTSDPSEATFVSTYLADRADKRPDGIVRYFDIVQLPALHLRRPVFALWREEATAVGDAFGGQYYGVYGRTEAESRLQSFLLVSALLRATMLRESENVRDTTKFLEEALLVLEKRWSDIEIDPDRIVETSWNVEGQEIIDAKRRYRGSTLGAWCLRALGVIAEMMANEPGATLVGEALSYYLERYILLADMHSGNMGRVVREDYNDPQMVITDPGHLIILPGAKISTPKMIGRRHT